MNRRGSVVVVAGAIVVALLVALALSQSSDDGDRPALRQAGNGDGGLVGSGHENTPVGSSLVLPIRTLCVDKDPVTITSVQTADPTGGLHVTSWGTRFQDASSPVLDDPGAVPGPVERIVGYGHHPVTAVCSDPDHSEQVTEFDVAVAGRAPRATMSGVLVHYGHGHTLFLQYGAALCATPRCDIPPLTSEHP